MRQGAAEQALLDLPTPALKQIIRHVIAAPTGVLSAPGTGHAVTLCRTSQRLRTATASSISSIHFSSEGFWPSASILAPQAWPELKDIDVIVNRSALIGFLKWLLTARGITSLRVKVEGSDYADERLVGLERMLLGRIFTQIGPELVVLDVEGFHCQSLMFAALFQCTKLRTLSIRSSAPGSKTMVNMLVLLCLANKHLESVCFPTEWETDVSDVNGLQASCQVTWETLFGNYRAGLKEAAVNLPSDENELVQSFKRMDLRMEGLGEDMTAALRELSCVGRTVTGGNSLGKVLFAVLPSLRQVNDMLVQQ